ncbi:citrate synthase family protein [bacterium]|nr:citrate synthase family protein [bacterium]
MKLLTSDQAAQALQVSKATLYAYVSRGQLESVEGPDRSRRYRWEDVERLRLRKVRPKEAAETALYWGLPTLESEISSIESGVLRYRGHEVVALAGQASLDQVAALLWTGHLDHPLEMPSASGWSGPFLSGGLSWLAQQLESDWSGWDLSPDGVRRTGWRIFQALRAHLPPHPLLEQALILCADHELNASTFAARVTASTGANPYAVVSAALATLSGPRHGGACAQVEALFAEASQSDPPTAIGQRLRRGDPVAGFGHPLYPEGDPRARALLQQLPHTQEWVEAGRQLLGTCPSIDLALVGLGLPPGGAFQVFATGRCLGWIAHALEQYADGRMIRPRGRRPL